MYAPTGDKNWVAVMRRVTDKVWFGRTSTAAIAPIALNNESLLAMNAAETGTVALIKANASDLPELPTGTVLNAPAVAQINSAAGVNRAIFNPTAKTIVDGSATSLFDVACAAGAMIGGGFTFLVEASDGTDHQTIAGTVVYSAVNKAGTHTCTITQQTGEAKAVSSGTLTLAFTHVTGTNKTTVKLQPTGSLTETVYRITYTLFPISGAVTIL
jgi:hypothetical protein